MLRDLFHGLKLEKVLKAQVVTADQNGASVDMQDKMAVMFMADIGTSGDTLSGSVKIELALQESDNNSDWSACADADVVNETGAAISGAQLGTFAVIDLAGEDDKVYKAGYKGAKRYARAIVNMVGTHTNGTPMSLSSVALPMKLPQ